MMLFMDYFWRALAYCLHPKVIMLSLLPLILMAVIVTGLGAMYWDLAVDTVRTGMEAGPVLGWAWTWLERVGLLNLKTVLAPCHWHRSRVSRPKNIRRTQLWCLVSVVGHDVQNR